MIRKDGFAGRLMEVIYPRRCPVCDKVLEYRGKLICDECRAELAYVEEPRCMRCGGPVETQQQEYCFACASKKHSYTRGYSIFIYNDAVRKAMSDFKFNNKRDNADFFVFELISHSKEFLKRFKPELIVPVPIHRMRLRERGFNQADIFAAGLGAAYDLPVCPGALVRVKKTLPQKGLGSKARIENLDEAFAVQADEKQLLVSKKILLVDDIYTTGSTIESCAQTLYAAGAAEVGFISVCIGSTIS